MLLDVGVDSCLSPVSSCYSGSSCSEPKISRNEELDAVNLEFSETVSTEVLDSLQSCTETLDPVNSCHPDMQVDNQKSKFKGKTFLRKETQDFSRTVGVDATSVEIREEELELIRGAVEKVLRGGDNISEDNEEAMDTDSFDNIQRLSSDSLSDVTPESENIAVASTECVFVCPNFDRTVIILDWDDTLLSSSWLAGEGLKVDETQEVPDAVYQELNELEGLVLSLLIECSKHGIVSIVTNAETGWVELSSKKFIPRVFSYIEEGIRVVSARSNFEKEFPDSPAQWKEKAFLLELGRLPVDMTRLNLLVLGDSLNERDAGHVAGTVYTGSHVKSVKFIERPTIEQLKRQLSLIISSLHHLCDHEGSFDVNMVC
ncbi:uncharacterized protein Gasu_11000 [Galdieria sulphuraria]|uniref:Uncharacterized protein n=1 Tax=Galdieria sulphuraria TaxID=130081 RepID=M2XNF7_GALSU|nr:uncharacterized protein Gasu_11000 [Galdieria sulphuraria]EME31722.1 hypothetical protein Gasu_11000 [Galdieria sulphuraria]|eukprot:XP_005708242.1 hypothetical protein Gasu_11000 [Galdieria sulphuraria]